MGILNRLDSFHSAHSLGGLIEVTVNGVNPDIMVGEHQSKGLSSRR